MSDDEHIFCGGNASPNDHHLASTVVGVDDEVLAVIAKRERARQRRKTGNASDNYRE